MTPDTNVTLMDRSRILRSLKRMAHEIVEQNSEDKPVALVGINERGYAVADLLADILGSMVSSKVTTIQMPLNKEHGQAAKEAAEEMEAINRFLVVVDDVIFSGKTMFTALKKISDILNHSELHTAVLIDRGHRKFPIQAEFCGMELPTKLNEHVSVAVDDGKVQQVILSSKR